MAVKIETRKRGKLIRTEHVAAIAPALPPFERAEAAGLKIEELMSKESISLDEAMARSEVEQAARDAVIGAEPVRQQARVEAPAQQQPEQDADGKALAAIYHRYLLSCANQTRPSFDDMSADELGEMMVHPKFTSMKFLPFQDWVAKIRG